MKKINFKKRHIALMIAFVLGIFDILFLGMSFSYKIPKQLTEYSGVVKETKLIEPNFWDYVFQTHSDHCFRITFEDSSKTYKIPGSVLDGFEIEAFYNEISIGQNITILVNNERHIYKLTANEKDYLSLEDSNSLMEKNRSQTIIFVIIILALIVISLAAYFGLLIISKYKSNQ